MSEVQKHNTSKWEKKEKSVKKGITNRDFYIGLDEAIISNKKKETEDKERLVGAISGTKTTPIARQEETENRLPKELSEKIKTTTK